MLQNGTSPRVFTGGKVTACRSAMPTSKAFRHRFHHDVERTAGGHGRGSPPTIFGFFPPTSTMVGPKTSWYLGG